MHYRISLRVPRLHTRSAKVVLEEADLLARDIKIAPLKNEPPTYLIPTCITSECASGLGLEEASKGLFSLLRTAVPDVVWDVDSLSLHPAQSSTSNSSGRNAVQSAMLQAAYSLATTGAADDDPQRDQMIMRLGKAFCVYTPMLLLSAGKDVHMALDQLTRYAASRNFSVDAFLGKVAQGLGVTHIALNAPIPGSVSDNRTSVIKPEDNRLRSPVNLQPLYGDFGTLQAAFPEHKPSLDDFKGAFWVHVRQNGILQVWAPYYTMFSAGNVTEKARLIKLDTVQKSVADGQVDGKGCTAVDLFAGIGYFAFSYLKAGFSKVLCWDLNPWSIEGLRRGALANKWTITVREGLPMDQLIPLDASLLAFRESNELAADRIRLLQNALPPVRHVNCGMLPSSGEAWKIAVDVIDPVRGGWIHLHESVLVKSMQLRIDSIVTDVTTHVTSTRGVDAKDVHLDHVQKVKGVGPGLTHVVLDISIPPTLYF